MKNVLYKHKKTIGIILLAIMIFSISSNSFSHAFTDISGHWIQNDFNTIDSQFPENFTNISGTPSVSSLK